VPHAVLWLLRFPPFGEPRLRAEAARRGVAPERLIFTDVAAKQVHILRSSLADLFLDTPLCNAHTTGTDVLWSGVPILTLPGERFASRVGASLVTALGCADCVMPSHEAYEQRAVELATNPLALRALTARVRKNRCVACCCALLSGRLTHAPTPRRLTHPLFNTRKWVQNFDNALLTLWRMHACGEPPCDIDLPDVTARQRGHGA
jgi:protein O-GlcNAc transferase